MGVPAPEKDPSLLPPLPYFDEPDGPLDGPVDTASSGPVDTAFDGPVDAALDGPADPSTPATGQASPALVVASVFVAIAFLSMSIAEKLEVLRGVSWVPGRTDDAKLVIAAVMAVSAFAQALTGFGFAVVSVGTLSSMSWLLHSELYDVITPVAATLGALVGVILLLPRANQLEWDEILPLLLPCTLLTPVGIVVGSAISPAIANKILAVLILGFVAYVLSGAEPPKQFSSRPAAFAFGSLAGIFGGAFDVQGPPLVMYGNAKGWEPQAFRDTVLCVVALNSILVVLVDCYMGVGVSDFYYSYFSLTSLPGVLVGTLAGQKASEQIDPALFKRITLIMCLGLGLNLLAGA